MADNDKTAMTPKDASRVQSHADRTGTNEDFKRRAQRSAEKNTAEKGSTGNTVGDGTGGKGK